MSEQVQDMPSLHKARDPDHVLEKAAGVYESVVIMGYTNTGSIDFRASTNITRAQILWCIETCKSMLMDFSDEYDE